MVETEAVMRAQAEMYGQGWLDGLQEVPRAEPGEGVLPQCAMAQAYWLGYCDGSLVLLLDRWPVERLN